ncbi:MAG: hypothetical protein GY783_10530 [Gammaproteobacteria bacterium]|nr:hypothetical protein [Gammaproteobacteria bacterium]
MWLTIWRINAWQRIVGCGVEHLFHDNFRDLQIGTKLDPHFVAEVNRRCLMLNH